MTRRFEFDEGGSKKFWEVGVEGGTLTVRFGKIGTDGQTKPKDLGSPDAATKEMNKLIAEKTKKGYAEVGASPAAAAVVPAPVVAAPIAPSGPNFPSLYVETGNRLVTWSCVRSDLRRRIDPDHGGVVAALVHGWRIVVRSRGEAEALLARAAALPVGEPHAEPAALLAWPGWDDLEDGRDKHVIVGAILAARTSDGGPSSVTAMAKGPAAGPLAMFRARQDWADGWVRGAFEGFHEGTATAPATYLVSAGAMGDAFLAMGAAGGKIAGLPFARRTQDANGKKHSDGIAGVLIAHAAWDEGCSQPVDLSDVGLTDALAQTAGKLAQPTLVLGASYDSRS